MVTGEEIPADIEVGQLWKCAKSVEGGEMVEAEVQKLQVGLGEEVNPM